MFSRVSTHLLTDTFIERLQLQTQRLAELQEQISSGRRLSQPDQNPSAFVELRLNEEQVSRLATFRLNITTANARLNQSVSTLQDVNLILRRAQEIALEANNASTDASARTAYALEIDGLINQLLQAANTRVGDEYIFSGTAVNRQPFRVAATDPEGRPTLIEYRGGSEPTRAVVASDRTIDVYPRGDQVFQRTGSDVFDALLQLRDVLRDTSLDPPSRAQAMQQRLEELQSAQQLVLETIGYQSATLEALEALDGQLGNLKLVSQERVADLGNTDIVEVAVRLREIENLYEATLGLTARIMQTSFLDFIR